MVRLRATRAVRALTLEEKTRVANLFTLLIKVNLEKGITNKRRAPQTAKVKTTECTTHKTKKDCPIDKFYNQSSSRHSSSIRTARRDLYLQQFIRIIGSNPINFTKGILHHDRHHHFNTHSRHL